MSTEFRQGVTMFVSIIGAGVLAGLGVLAWVVYDWLTTDPYAWLYVGIVIGSITLFVVLGVVLHHLPDWLHSAQMAAQVAVENRRIEAEARLLDSQGKEFEAKAALLLAQAKDTTMRSEYFLIGQDQLPIHYSNVDHRAAYYLVDKDIEMRSRPRSITWNQLLGEGGNRLLTSVPSFASLWESGQIEPGKLLVGFNAEGQPLFVEWRQLYHLAVSGKTGMGKTNTEALIAAQMALGTFKLAIIDAHGDTDGSLVQKLLPLKRSFYAAPAIEEPEILSLAKLVRSELAQRRKQLGVKHQKLLLLVDEATGLLNRTSIAGELGPMLEEILQEGRKMGIFLMQSGQIWSAARTGGNSAMRASFASALVHRTDKDQARMLIPSDYAKEVEAYKPGQAIFKDAQGDVHTISVPLVTARDIELIAEATATRSDGTKVYTVPQIPSTPVDVRPAGVHIGVHDANEGESGTPESGNADVQWTPEEQFAFALFMQGKTRKEIYAEAFGFTGDGGRRQVELSTRLDAIIRQGVRG